VTSRLAAAVAAVFTALLLQATLIGPVTAPVPISLPAVLVAVVALYSGPGTGISLGFAAGLLADLGSAHPAGVLALAWLGLGLAAGMLADPDRSWVRQALLAGTGCAVVAAGVTVLLALLDSSAADGAAVLVHLAPTALGDGLLAVLLIPAARSLLASPALRSSRAATTRRALPRG